MRISLRPAGRCRLRFGAAAIGLLLAGILVLVAGAGLAQDPYFVHIADPHVAFWSTARWELLLDEILLLDPAPDLVVCSGDLVEYGAGLTGQFNYDALLGVPSLSTVGGDHYLDDGQHSIPIFFSPGNHDYRGEDQLIDNLDNYIASIHSLGYYHEIVAGRWAIFSLDSGYDVYVTGSDLLPEGAGLYGGAVSQFESDLDLLDGVADGMDSSDYEKIVFLHHPHQYPDGQMCSLDGIFEEHRSDFIRICEDYAVGWALFGHKHPVDSEVFDLYCDEWSAGSGTKCVISIAAKEKGFRREWPDGTGDDVVLWTRSAVDAPEHPAALLEQNRPNPFNPSTTIRFALTGPAHARLAVHDVLGRRLATLVDELLPAGAREYRWRGVDDQARAMPSGMYFYRLEAAGTVQTRRMVLLR